MPQQTTTHRRRYRRRRPSIAQLPPLSQAEQPPANPPPAKPDPIEQRMIQLINRRPFPGIKEFKEAMELVRTMLGQLLTDTDIDLDFFIRTATNAYTSTPELRQCASKSVIDAISVGAQQGLLVNGVGGEAWLSAFECKWLENAKMARLLTGYQGLLKLAYQHPRVRQIESKIWRERDHFDFADGTDPHIIHKYKPGADRGGIAGAYCISYLAGMEEMPSFTIMAKAEIDACRDTSRDKDSLMWTAFPDTGCQKTVFRRHSKWVPKSRRLRLALAYEDSFEQGKPISDMLPTAAASPEANMSRSQQLLKQLEGADSKQ